MKNSTNPKPWLAAVCAVIAVIPVGASEGWDLDSCITYALARNTGIRQQQLTAEEQNLEYRQARRDVWPSLNAGASYGSSVDGDGLGDGSGQYSVSAQWTAFNGTILPGIRQKRLTAESADEQVRLTGSTVVFNVIDAYLQVLYARDALRADSLAVDAAEERMKWVGARHEVGSAAELDVAQVRSTVSTARYALVQSRNALDARITEMKRLLGLPWSGAFSLEYPADDDSVVADLPALETVVDAALAYRPEIKIAELELAARKLELRTAYAGYFPEVGVGASVSSAVGEGVTGDPSAAVQVSLSIPLWDNGRNRTGILTAESGIERAEVSLADAKTELCAAVEEAYREARAARYRYAAAEERLEAERGSYRLAQEQYRNGMLTARELQLETDAWAAAQDELLQARYAAVYGSELLDYYRGAGRWRTGDGGE